LGARFFVRISKELDMKKQVQSNSAKLSLNKTTLKNLTTQTGVKAGACSKNWSYHPSKGPNGCGIIFQG